jgi:hypothetical protein
MGKGSGDEGENGLDDGNTGRQSEQTQKIKIKIKKTATHLPHHM